MHYNRCGESGLRLPAISLGLWHNFGEAACDATARDIVLRAYDQGVTHFDLANNYGPPPGAAEVRFGNIFHADLAAHRDEIIVSTKAGYDMWSGPYGSGGSRKHLLASLDQSLRRLRLDYVDVFYSHRYDPQTPLEETMGALAHAVHTGKALYAGISNYPEEQAAQAFRILRKLRAPCLLNQWRFNILNRTCREQALGVSQQNGVGVIAFSPLAQGLLTDRYLEGIPADSRMAQGHFLKPEMLTGELLQALHELNDLALSRGLTLAALALNWVMDYPGITSVIVGASSTQQLDASLKALEAKGSLGDEVYHQVDNILHRNNVAF